MSRFMDTSAEGSERSLVVQMRDVLRLFTEQQTILQTTVVANQTSSANYLQQIKDEVRAVREELNQLRHDRSTYQHDMRSVKDELNQLRSVISSGHTSRDTFESYRTASEGLLQNAQQQHQKEFDRLLEMFDRISVRATAAVVHQQAPPAAAYQQPPMPVMLPPQQHAVQPAAHHQPSVVQQVKPQPAVQQPQQPAAPPAAQPAAAPTSQAGLRQPGEWDCEVCYGRNKPADGACLACHTPKGAKTEPTAAAAATAFKPQTFGAPKAATPAATFGIAAPASAPKFGAAPPAAAAPPPAASASFGATSTASGFSFLAKPEAAAAQSPVMQPPPAAAQQKPVNFSFNPSPFGAKPATPAAAASPAASTTGGSLFGGGTNSPAPKNLFASAAPGSTFAQAAQTASGSSWLQGNTSNADKFKVDPKASPLFGGGLKACNPSPKGGPAADDEDGGAHDDTAPEDFVPDDSQFKRPDVELPSLVERTTGEENEDVLFTSRARVYRFFSDTKEVKERGTGELKLLKHKETGRLRVIARRDQVLKLCANFSIAPNFTAQYTNGKDNTLLWTCTDFSELDEHPQGEVMVMLCRFKTKEDAARFKELVEQQQPPSS